MVLKITSVEDLKKYLETRRKMAENQGKSVELGLASKGVVKGMVYAFDEAIKAVEALLTHDHEEER